MLRLAFYTVRHFTDFIAMALLQIPIHCFQLPVFISEIFCPNTEEILPLGL